MRIFHFNTTKYGFELMMDLHRFEENPNLDFEPNVHTIDFYEIMFLEQSCGDIVINEHEMKLKPYTILFSSPNQKKKNTIKNAKGFHLVFKDDFLAHFFSDKLFIHRLHYFYNAIHPQFFKTSQKEYQFIKGCLTEIYLEINNYTLDSKHIIRSLLYFILTKLNRLYCNQYNISNETQIQSDVYKLKELLENNIRKLHKVEDYLSLLAIDRNKLNKILKAYNGLTAQQMIHKRLLQEIKTELRYTNKTINEIAIDLSFSEANNLSRFFLKKELITPLKYRKMQNDRK